MPMRLGVDTFCWHLRLERGDLSLEELLPEVGRKVLTWLERALALESPILRVVSGFYRAEFAGRPDLVDAERSYVTEVLRAAGPDAGEAGVDLLLENHSDFTVAEYEAI